MTKISIAEEILSRLNNVCAVTLEHGYAVTYDHKRILFPPGAISEEKRNEKGRCTHLISTYPDGSKLKFQYDEHKGAHYRVHSPHQPKYRHGASVPFWN